MFYFHFIASFLPHTFHEEFPQHLQCNEHHNALEESKMEGELLFLCARRVSCFISIMQPGLGNKPGGKRSEVGITRKPVKMTVVIFPI